MRTSARPSRLANTLRVGSVDSPSAMMSSLSAQACVRKLSTAAATVRPAFFTGMMMEIAGAIALCLADWRAADEACSGALAGAGRLS